MEAEERTPQSQEVTGESEPLFPILSMQQDSLQHLTAISIPQIIKSLSESRAANTCYLKKKQKKPPKTPSSWWEF